MEPVAVPLSHDEAMTSASAAQLLEAQRPRLWGLAYRMTGSAADADDCVQEAFARWLAGGEPARAHAAPWLVRAVVNLSLDALRRRRRRAYRGPWLPVPLDDPEQIAALEASDTTPDPEAHVGLLESASIAFLTALEVLGPRQRAALLLREVLGMSADEIARVLGTSAGNVRVLQRRARRALGGEAAQRVAGMATLRERHRAAAERFLRCLATRDAAGLEALLADSVQTRTDAGGEFTALATPLAGRTRVATFYLRAARHREGSRARVRITSANGLAAIAIELGSPVRRQAPRSLLCFELDAADRIAAVYAVLASRKLSHLRAWERNA
jgi:RNA polymerase sigma-70 factor (ECF subfamily)